MKPAMEMNESFEGDINEAIHCDLREVTSTHIGDLPSESVPYRSDFLVE
jgi:hypothetical protein